MKYIFYLLSLFLWSCTDSSRPDELTYIPTTELKTQASFPIGLATQSARILDPAHTAILEKEFNSLTAEWEMKQNVFLPAAASYNWTPADVLVAYAESKGYRVHGHALLWHNAVPGWLQSFSGTPTEFEAIIKEYIQMTVGRYQGKVISWDVVNEAFEDESGALRQSIFQQMMGDDYIARCFQYAREADPDALLFYNDYGTIWDNKKRDAMLAMLDDFKARNIPIDGIGFQMHINYNWPSLNKIEKVVEAVRDRGLLIHFSELDVRANPDNNQPELSLKRAGQQENRIKEIVEIYQSIPPDQQFGITVWGLRDPESWLLSYWGHEDWPLLFDEDYRYKVAHRGFVEGL